VDSLKAQRPWAEGGSVKSFSTDVLNDINRYIDRDAIIAGGAPRNWDQGKYANDVDIYLRSGCGTERDRVEQLRRILQKDLVVQTNTCMTAYHNELGIEAVVTVLIKGCTTPFQFIYVDNKRVFEGSFMDQVMNHMDIGINKVSIAPFGTSIVKTCDYVVDYEDRVLTVYVNNQSPKQLSHCLEHHLPKMVKYYPDFDIQVDYDKTLETEVDYDCTNYFPL
jgi:hypothetical protein